MIITPPLILWIILSSVGFGVALLDTINAILDLRAVKAAGVNGDRKLLAKSGVRDGFFRSIIMLNNVLLWVGVVLGFVAGDAILYGLVFSVFLLTLKILFDVADRYIFLGVKKRGSE